MKKCIEDEIEEVGDISLIALIPYYLEIIYDKEITYPLFDNPNNYIISNTDFKHLNLVLNDLFKSNNLGLFVYQEKRKGRKEILKWDDVYILLNDDVAKEILSKKSNWIYNKDAPAYFIAEKNE